MGDRKLIILNRVSEQQPWGFRLQGGTDFKTPLSVQLVQPGSVAEEAGLCPGDAVLRINNIPTENIMHEDAKNEIIRSGNIVECMIERGGATTVWRPQVTPLSQLKPNQLNTQQFHNDEPVFTQTSLKHEHQESLNIGSSHNRAAAPFSGYNQGPEIVHAQFNSPKGLYSNRNAEQVYKQSEQQLAEMTGAPYHADTKPGVGPTGFRSVMAPTAKPISEQRPAPQLMRCGACDGTIVGVFVKVKGIPMHPGCLKCVRCGVNLKNVGYFFIENQLFCETHAKQVTRPGYGGFEAAVQYK